MGTTGMKSSNTRVLIVALAANVGIAVAKFVAAAFTGSSAMLTEGVHSLVDSTNQLLLLYGQKRSVKAPDVRYPGGYGRELYFWSFVVALLVFALGAGVSVYEGVLHMLDPEPAVDPLIAYGVLLVAFVLEGGSTIAAFKEFNGARKGKSWWKALTGTKDATVVIVLLENGAAMAGLIVAAIGLALAQITGNPHFDGAASIVIGLLLGSVAIFLAREGERPADRRGGRPGAGDGSTRSGIANRDHAGRRDHHRPQRTRSDSRGDERGFRQPDLGGRCRTDHLRNRSRCAKTISCSPATLHPSGGDRASIVTAIDQPEAIFPGAEFQDEMIIPRQFGLQGLLRCFIPQPE